MIYDCFPFFSEIEMLELRLHTLRDVVDRFVIVEANQTFTGKPKEFLLPQYSSLMDEFRDQIIYVQVADMPDSENPWDRAFHQKNAIMRGLTGCEGQDLILVSDLDEIPRPEGVRKLTGDANCREVLQSYPIAFAQRNFYYFVNCADSVTWQGTVASPFKRLKSPQKLRDLRERAPRLSMGGWHFSYTGGAERIIYKLNSYCDTKNNTPQNNSPEYIMECIKQGSSVIQVGEKPKKYEFVEIDESFPEYMGALIKKYPYLYYDAPTKTAASAVFPKESAGPLGNKPRWYWYLLRKALSGEKVET